MPIILLAGATGMVGAEALKLLLANERVRQVVAPTRRALPPHAKLRNPIVTSRDIQLASEWWAADGGIYTLGTTLANAGSAAAYRAIDYDYTLAVVAQVGGLAAAAPAVETSYGLPGQPGCPSR